MLRNLLLELFLARKDPAAVQDFPVFPVASLYLAVLPRRVGARPPQLHPLLPDRFFERALPFCLFMVIDELRAIVHLDRLDFESHPSFQHVQKLHRLIGALLLHNRKNTFPAVLVYRRYLVVSVSIAGEFDALVRNVLEIDLNLVPRVFSVQTLIPDITLAPYPRPSLSVLAYLAAHAAKTSCIPPIPASHIDFCISVDAVPFQHPFN